MSIENNTLKKYKSDSKSSRKQLLELGNKILSINHVDRKDYIKKFNTLKESLESEVLTEHESAPTTIITSSAGYPSHTPDDSTPLQNLRKSSVQDVEVRWFSEQQKKVTIKVISSWDAVDILSVGI